MTKKTHTFENALVWTGPKPIAILDVPVAVAVAARFAKFKILQQDSKIQYLAGKICKIQDLAARFGEFKILPARFAKFKILQQDLQNSRSCNSPLAAVSHDG